MPRASTLALMARSYTSPTRTPSTVVADTTVLIPDASRSSMRPSYGALQRGYSSSYRGDISASLHSRNHTPTEKRLNLSSLTTSPRMARTRNAAKRQRDATVQSALFNPDVVCLLAALLDAQDLCQMSLTCKAIGGKQAGYNGLSLAEEAARQLFEQSATEWEGSCLLKHDGEGWVELYRHLLMLRSKLTFDQLVGANIQYGEEQSSFRASTLITCSALCSNHVMRSGRHFTTFTFTAITDAFACVKVGIVRPVQIIRSNLISLIAT
ncbi:hypothetical protein THAOC_08551 [Thalassiosira oceanica]|uniref:F-box domain-containing protein n=1 Tax=Thalassiosira oceanica TaxID=159749 RepID=K0THY2_THAOC|nr:hypothetical protein THAOC_08551 [Thalassiosira oceanica]|eukprot:EJK70117.1 hypothetical protein THAOC_08551 [Thalassiosira oceanica]